VERADWDDRICIIGLVRVADLKPVLDVLDNDAAELGLRCSGCVNKVLLELSDELVAPSCMELAVVQVRCSLGFGAL
jgi:hypothetical protein